MLDNLKLLSVVNNGLNKLKFCQAPSIWNVICAVQKWSGVSNLVPKMEGATKFLHAPE